MLKFKNICLILIFVLACTVRFVDLGTHFVHLDDAVIILDILRAKQPAYKQELIELVYNPLTAHHHTKQKSIIKHIYENPRTRFIFDSVAYLARFLIIPTSATNAPLQFLITPFLINNNQNYTTLLFYGRLPSCLFSLLTVLLVYFILRKNNTTALLCGVLFCALSLENIIFAKQSYSYAIGCLSAAGLLFLLQHSKAKGFFNRHWLFSSFLTTLFAYTHYQSFFLLPAYYLVNLYFKRSDWPEAKKLILSGFLNIVFCLPALFLLFLNLGIGVTSYNIGLNGEFLFTADKNIIWFLLRNGFLVLTHTLSPVTADKLVYWFLGGIFSIGFLAGLRKCYKTPEGLFIIISLLIYIGLVLAQQLTLTPTRNALVYLPLYIYIIAQSLPQLKSKVLAIILLIYTGIFLFYFPNFVSERKTKLQEQGISQIISEYNPYFIGEYGWVNTPLLKPLRQKYKHVDRINYQPNHPADFKTIIFIDTYLPLNKQQFQLCQDFWNNKKLNTPWANTYEEYEIVYEKIITSNIELEPNYWNSNGTNNLFFYVLKLK